MEVYGKMSKFIKLQRVVGYSDIIKTARINVDEIQFYFGDVMLQTGEDVNVTTIAFKEHTVHVLETPEEIDELIGNL